ncbi:IclR family transcriptional regulator [Amycolatopsis umgeniensis]|uniref:DNA-binding IclR family transcriptional regulator n=1 Tax=Amycolatopsis umgeniensis TaxID=336628 RepID=A0A841BFJ0_9PSEU|nr:IclR family transcriptional regulator [Amycolatopsis umgeniensis]MBB5857555.1 DNA-binding IclR family transcriptional regulator [Amycolatopsis umgeniensis]
MSEEADQPTGSVRSMNSVLNTLRVFEEVAVRQPIGVSELARVTEIPKGTVQRCLVTLRQAGWLKIMDPERARWGVTRKVLALGLRSTGERDLQDVAKPVLEGLAAETDETVILGLRDGECLVILAREDTTQVVRVFLDVGTRVPLRATSGGTAIMALLDDAEVDELLRHELTEFADAPVPDVAELRREIAQTAKRGYALNGSSSWYRPHVASIGAAITNPLGHPIATVTLAIPEMRFHRAQEHTFAPLVMAAAAEISHLLTVD